MPLLIINSILSICLLILIIILWTRIKYKVQEDVKTKYLNEALKTNNEALKKANDNLKSEIDKLDVQYKLTQTMLDDLEEQYKQAQESSQKTLENQKKLCEGAFSNYWKVLENSYKEKEKEFDNNLSNITKNFENEKKKIEADLDKIRQTRAAAIQASLREEEIKQKKEFYCVTITPQEQSDIIMLESIKPKLNKPRILSMLIWSTFFQKPMTALCTRVLGPTVKTGIYKITNQLNNKCYIGQAIDIATRWKEHAKCGLDIDTPAGNKLYQAMLKDGLQNFSFEILEECPRTELNEKEKYYIQLYQSKEYGYNSTAGNK